MPFTLFPMNNWKKVFAIIWSGQFFSILTSSMVNFAIVIWLSIQTGSAEILAWATVAALLPQAVLGPFSGVLIDRWNRKRVMMLADSFIAFCTLVLAVLFRAGIAEMWHIFVLLALRSAGSAFHMPAMQASVPMIAPADQLTRIAGINQIIASASNIAGPALGALLITVWNLEYVLLLDVAGALIAVGSLFFVYIPNPPRSAENARNIFREMKEGVMAVARSRGLSWIFLYSVVVTFFLMPVSVLFPLMTLRYFGGTGFQAGMVEALWSVGTLAGGIIMGVRVYRVNRVLLINWMYVVVGTVFFVSGLLPSGAFAWFAALTVVSGISGAVYSSAFTGIMQSRIDPDALGRVFSMYNTFSLIPSMLGLVGIGFLADGLGLTATFFACGIVITAVGIAAFATPSAVRVDASAGNAGHIAERVDK